MQYSIRQLKLKTRMIVVFGFMVLVQTGLIGLYALTNLNQSLNEQIAQRALHVAKTIAAMPQVISAVERQQTQDLPQLAATMAAKNDALFVVIGDRQGIRLAHPTPRKIGQPMYDDEGDYNEPALVHGKPYTSVAVGSLGASMRGKAPIFDVAEEQVIGVVSVGFKMDTVQLITSRYFNNLLAAIILSLFASVVIALWFTYHLQKAIFGLEPEQIGRLFQERNATLESVREGIIAINKTGQITTINKAAITTLGLATTDQLQGQYIQQVLPGSRMLEVLQSGQPEFDQEVWLRDRSLIANRIPLQHNHEITGVVSSFRLKNELDLVSQKLTDIQAYADTLRSQSHEYANKLQTIAGLIQIGNADAALSLIGQESRSHQELISLLTEAVANPILSGCLMGKFNRAKELGLALHIDPESSMNCVPEELHIEQLVSVLGNLIDNALEATLANSGHQVSLQMTDLGQELIFEIDDEGSGVSEADQQRIFDWGYTSKTDPGHGIGLHLVAQLLPLIHARLTIENIPSGCRVTLYVDKNNGGKV
ncbi:MAG TPA: sensor histidine kinase [Oceanospirillaceae bacterium]|nr:sensor histidine kinase [Oceanospirillaceae bacterium]